MKVLERPLTILGYSASISQLLTASCGACKSLSSLESRYEPLDPGSGYSGLLEPGNEKEVDQKRKRYTIYWRSKGGLAERRWLGPDT